MSNSAFTPTVFGQNIVVPGVSPGQVSASGLPGNTSGAAVAAGFVGEVIRNAGTGGTPVSGNFIQTGSISLGGGRWRVEGVSRLSVSGTQISGLTVVIMSLSLNSSSIDLSTAGGFFQGYPPNPPINTDSYFYTTPRIFDLPPGSTTIYLLSRIDFSTLNSGIFNATNSFIQATRIT
ncbi:MAG: hypothetical protein RLZZ74_3423 [Cyanobacteriota bacterium]|jgi:hypothetical protein